MYLAVCEDQADELEQLTKLLHQWQTERGIPLPYQSFRSAAQLLDVAQQEHFTLYLLDILMPGINGIAAAREIRSFDETAEIVFLTSYPGFAYESYSVHAMDYLLKPIRSETLFPILDKLLLREQKPQEGLTLKCGTTLVRVPFSQLAYVEVSSKHLYFNLTDGQVLETVGTLRDHESLLLDHPEFLHVHRSYVVNILQIREFSPAGITTFSGKKIPIPRRQYAQLQKEYLRRLFDRKEG